jgi:hypothetical protein
MKSSFILFEILMKIIGKIVKEDSLKQKYTCQKTTKLANVANQLERCVEIYPLTEYIKEPKK